MIDEWVWIFTGNHFGLSSAVFEKKDKAKLWIKQYALSGTLTKYPVDISAYDWALKHKFFKVKKEHQKTPDFIGQFTCGFVDHEHYDEEHVPNISNYENLIENVSFNFNGWIWFFVGDGGRFPSGVFKTQHKAEVWIKHYSLNGTLSKYPIGISVYNWSIQNSIFTPKNEVQRSSSFISTFGWGYTEHVHYINGLRWGNEEISDN